MREYETGATRDSNQDKLDYRGFLSPRVLREFAEYMHRHRTQADGSMRGSSNWKLGIPPDDYMESAFRHWMLFWEAYEEGTFDREHACALIFNMMGLLHEELK